jgi:hypothetical protein
MPSTAKGDSTHEIEDAINEEFGLPRMDQLGKREHFILKLCDRLDLYIWAKEQLAGGNTYIKEVIDNLDCVFGVVDAFTYEPGTVRAEEFADAEYLWRSLHFVDRVVPNRTNLLQKIKERHGIGPSSR